MNYSHSLGSARATGSQVLLHLSDSSVKQCVDIVEAAHASLDVTSLCALQCPQLGVGQHPQVGRHRGKWHTWTGAHHTTCTPKQMHIDASLRDCI